MAAYKLSLKAKNDLRQIYQYGVLQYSEHQADKYYTRLFERFEQIAKTPYMYSAVEHIHTGYKRSICGIHSIYYRINNETVEIIRILGRQDTQSSF